MPLFSGRAEISGNAKIHDKAEISGPTVKIKDNAEVFETAFSFRQC